MWRLGGVARYSLARLGLCGARGAPALTQHIAGERSIRCSTFRRGISSSGSGGLTSTETNSERLNTAHAIQLQYQRRYIMQVDAADGDDPTIVLTSQDTDYAQSAASQNVVNFGLGQPGPDILKSALAMSRKGFARALEEGVPPTVMQYAAVQGYRGVRESVAAFLARRYSENSESVAVNVSLEDILMTAGVSHGLDVCARALVMKHAFDAKQKGEVAEQPLVIMEEPTYFLARRMFIDAGLKAVGVGTDEGGLDVDDLERKLAGGEWKEQGCPLILYTIPTHNNPRGTTLSHERRKRLVDVCRHHGVTVLADDVYQILSFPGYTPPPPLRHYDVDGEVVVSVGSFSKILAPSLRVGWVEAGSSLMAQFLRNGVLNSGGSLSPIAALSIKHNIDDGDLDTHIALCSEYLSKRCSALCASLAKHLPQIRFIAPSGGYFVWLDLPEGTLLEQFVDTGELLNARGGEIGVSYCAGARCSVEGRQQHAIRLSFAFYTPEELELGVRRLKRLLGR